MIRSIAAIILFVAVTSAYDVPITKCGTAAGSVTQIYVVPCSSDVCVFKPDMDVTVTGKLNPTVAAEKPTLSVQVEVAGFFVEYPGLSKDACEYLRCPLKAGVDNDFTIRMKTLDWLPPMKTKMQFHVYASEGGEELACAQADIEVEK